MAWAGAAVYGVAGCGGAVLEVGVAIAILFGPLISCVAVQLGCGVTSR